MNSASLEDTFDESGRIWLRSAISEEDLRYFDTASQVSDKAGQRLTNSAALQHALRPDGSFHSALRRHGVHATPVRVVAFNKTRDRNWGVPWHQDRVIAVAEKIPLRGYSNWTLKSGIWHCEPPLEVLDQMLFVRIHLDDCDATNGTMKIALGSHLEGIIPASKAAEIAEKLPTETCLARRGDVLVMKMLTVHASDPANTTSARRVLRIDLATSSLPAPLAWNDVASDS